MRFVSRGCALLALLALPALSDSVEAIEVSRRTVLSSFIVSLSKRRARRGKREQGAGISAVVSLDLLGQSVAQ